MFLYVYPSLIMISPDVPWPFCISRPVREHTTSAVSSQPMASSEMAMVLPFLIAHVFFEITEVSFSMEDHHFLWRLQQNLIGKIMVPACSSHGIFRVAQFHMSSPPRTTRTSRVHPKYRQVNFCFRMRSDHDMFILRGYPLVI